MASLAAPLKVETSALASPAASPVKTEIQAVHVAQEPRAEVQAEAPEVEPRAEAQEVQAEAPEVEPQATGTEKIDHREDDADRANVEEVPAREDDSAAANDENYQELLAQARATGKRKTREQLLIKATEANPRGDEAYARLAIMLMEHPRRREEAFGYANKAVENNPNNAHAWLVLGYLHQLKNERQASRDAYARCAAAPGPKKIVSECRALGR